MIMEVVIVANATRNQDIRLCQDIIMDMSIKMEEMNETLREVSNARHKTRD